MGCGDVVPNVSPVIETRCTSLGGVLPTSPMSVSSGMRFCRADSSPAASTTSAPLGSGSSVTPGRRGCGELGGPVERIAELVEQLRQHGLGRDARLVGLAERGLDLDADREEQDPDARGAVGEPGRRPAQLQVQADRADVGAAGVDREPAPHVRVDEERHELHQHVEAQVAADREPGDADEELELGAELDRVAGDGEVQPAA